MKNIKDIEIYEDGGSWYVKYTQDEQLIISEAFILEETAITFSLNLKFI